MRNGQQIESRLFRLALALESAQRCQSLSQFLHVHRVSVLIGWEIVARAIDAHLVAAGRFVLGTAVPMAPDCTGWSAAIMENSEWAQGPTRRQASVQITGRAMPHAIIRVAMSTITFWLSSTLFPPATSGGHGA